ncbi:unnamed protein product [Dicrocoelium dendriticum]|nr:unnamed protein product [Dicrocoelium dendriticum]
MSSIVGCRLRWDLGVEELTSRTASLIEKSRALYDSIGRSTDPTWDTTAKRLSLFEAEFSTQRNNIEFPQHVFQTKEIRDASVRCSRQISDLIVELSMRTDVFRAFVAIQSKLDDSVPPEMARYVNRKVRDGRRNGLHLDEEVRSKIEALFKEENRLCIDFSHALGEENTMLEFTKEELTGCPEDFLCSLKTMPSGKLQLSLKYPHYIPAIEKACNPDTRKKLECAFTSRCVDENKPILKRLMAIRKECSELLGFPTHADYTVDIRMAKSAANVAKFLQGVAEKLEPLYLKERARFLELKKQECDRLNIPFSGQLDPWDLRYYSNLVKEKDYAVDQQTLKKHFPLDVVKAGTLRLYQHLLGLTFARVETTEIWHPDVEMYSVRDTDTNTLLGYFYLDLHPREGKYSHAAVFELQPSCLCPASEGAASGEAEDHRPIERQLAVAAMVANFTAPTADQPKPCLLHEELETFFHEFGHLMHHICSQVDCAIFGGLEVETDFVECPSQMLENWVWTEAGLKALLADEFDRIPGDTLKSLLASRNANAGTFNSRQILFASFDQKIHTSRWQDDPQDVFAELSREILHVDPSPGTCTPASFGHLAGGYDARYYSYMWSLVFSADMYETRFHHAPDGGCLSPSVGRDYREKILKPGASKDAAESLRDFLGREPNDRAFFKLLGLDAG